MNLPGLSQLGMSADGRGAANPAVCGSASPLFSIFTRSDQRWAFLLVDAALSPPPSKNSHRDWRRHAIPAHSDWIVFTCPGGTRFAISVMESVG